jgi:hypothetical protein
LGNTADATSAHTLSTATKAAQAVASISTASVASTPDLGLPYGLGTNMQASTGHGTSSRHSHTTRNPAKSANHPLESHSSGAHTGTKATALLVENHSGGSLTGKSGFSINRSSSAGSTDVPMTGQMPDAMAVVPHSGVTENPPSTLLDNAVHMTNPGWETAIAGRLSMAHPGQTFSVTVHPLTMGPIQVMATRTNSGGMRLHLTARHADTVTMLQQGAPVIAAQIMGNGNPGMGNSVTVTASVAQGTPSPTLSTSQQGYQDNAPHGDGHNAFARNVPLVHGSATATRPDNQGDPSSIIDTAGFESWV